MLSNAPNVNRVATVMGVDKHGETKREIALAGAASINGGI
jgi:hypothetical protein